MYHNVCGVARFLSSFNRPNLQYVVRAKLARRATEQVIELLRGDQLRGKCGIVYCLSRKDCDTMARTLQDNRIQAAAYHAGLSDKDRASVQQRWTSDIVKVSSHSLHTSVAIHVTYFSSHINGELVSKQRE
jgi:bloom syndrome protein